MKLPKKVLEHIELVEKSLKEKEYRSVPKGLYEPISYLLNLGGKRIRPALVMLGAEVFGKPGSDCVEQALAVEVFHNFTLMHDDIMDEAPLRRGQKTVHEKWNVNTAILSGDAMLIQSYQHLIKNVSAEKAVKLMEVFNQTALEVCEGQQFDMNFESSDEVTVEKYLEMIRLKTAVLLGGALKIGAVCAGAEIHEQKQLYTFGVELGVSFQILDDYLDVWGDPKLTGKRPGGDILANKKTFLLLTAMQDASGSDRELLEKWLNEKDQDSRKVEVITELFEKMGLDEKAKELSREYYQNAIGALKKIDVPETDKKGLLELAKQLVERNF
jgi:geranylgeranyl diphosphate synthase type II